MAVPRNVNRIGAIDGSAKLGCSARKTMAQMSWKMSRPTHSRPTMESVCRCSCRYLTTSSVDENAHATPR
jgi:hypothetical protein